MEPYEILARDFCKNNGLDSRQLAVALVKMAMPDVNAVEIPNLNAERERRPSVREGGEREFRGSSNGGGYNGSRGGNGGYKSGPPKKKEYGSYKGEGFGGKKPGGKKKFSREIA